jgi:endoglucanase
MSNMKNILPTFAVLFLNAVAAFGHGSMADPISRSYEVFLENPETPVTAAAKAAIAVAGTQPFYDWMEVRRQVPDYNYPSVIPDGQLPGVGLAKYAGLNLARTDWPATKVVPGQRVCRFYVTTAHDPSFFKAYITKDGYNPLLPLKWSDLVEVPGGETATLNGSNYYMTLNLPARKGRHVLYVVWQRVDPVGEVFFSTSDLDFGGVDYGVTPSPVSAPTATDTGTNSMTNGMCCLEAKVEFSFVNQWTGGGQGTFKITNTSTNESIKGWSVEFDWPADITSHWDGVILSKSGNHYVVQNAAYNGTIPPGGTASFGCVANFSTPNLQPKDIVFNGYSTAAPALSISTLALANGTVGSAYSQTFTATGGSGPYSWSLASGILPAGLTLSSAGILSGTPTAVVTSSFTLQVKDATSVTITRAYSLAVGAGAVIVAPVISSSATASGVVGSSFSYQITASNNPTSYAATGLPSGLAVNAVSGLISGTPTAAATSTISLKASNAGGTGTKTLTLTIAAAKAPVITSSATASGVVGSSFRYQITASNNPTSYAATGLPSGLAVNAASGLISGTPTVAATSTVSLKASNAGGTGTKTLTLTVAAAKAPVITSSATASAVVGSSFNYQITASNNPTSYAATGLPSGLAVNAASGLISGTPTAAATSTISLKASNAGGAGTKTLTLTVAAAPIVTPAPTPSPTPAPTPGSANGYLSTKGNQIVDANGNAVRITGVNWFGFETGNQVVHGLWSRGYRSMLDQVKSLGFNTLRIPFSNQMLASGAATTSINYSANPDLQGLTPIQCMDKVISYAGQIGLKVFLDRHSAKADNFANEDLWYIPGDSYYTEAQWINDWVMLAKRYAGNSTVIGADLFNEPKKSATWGNSAPATDWNKAAERCANAILGANPNWLIIVEGVEKYNNQGTWWGGNLTGAAQYPVILAVPNKLVYSAHDYPASVFSQTWFSDPTYPKNLPSVWNSNWGYLFQNQTAPVIVGEFGSKLVTASDQTWMRSLLAYMNGDSTLSGTNSLAPGQKGISWTYWSLNPNSGDTEGILNSDWTTVNTAKMAYLQASLAPLIGSPSGTGATTPTPAPSPTPVATPTPTPAPTPTPVATPIPTPTATPAPTPAPVGTMLSGIFQVTSVWDTGYNADLVIKNAGTSALASWTATLFHTDGIVTIWNGSSTAVSGGSQITPASWNASIPAGGSVTVGFTFKGAPPAQPSKLMVNGSVISLSFVVPTPTPAPTPAPTPVPVPTVTPGPTPIITPTPSASTNRVSARQLTGYFPSWSERFFTYKNFNQDGSSMTDAQLLAASALAQISTTPYTDIYLAFAQPNFTWAGIAANTWKGTGIEFSSSPQDEAQAIRLLHNAGRRVLLAVGGATYNSWSGLAAEAFQPNGTTTAPIRAALAQIMVDLKLDGLDVDYEVSGADTTTVSNYAGAILNMRLAVDLATQIDGRPRQLAVAAWSTGADYTAAVRNPANLSQVSYWGGSAGRERLTFGTTMTQGVYAGYTIASLPDVVNIMSYDAGYQHYDPAVAYDQYRALVPATTIVSIGLEIPPEAWGGAILVVNSADAYQVGTIIESDQYGKILNAPYSVQRSAAHVLSNRVNSKDGLMVWELLLTTPVSLIGPNGASVRSAVPATIATEAVTNFGSAAVAPIP